MVLCTIDSIGHKNRIDKFIGGDPYLHVLRANCHFLNDEPAKAREFIQKALAAEPTLIDAYWMVVHFALTDQDHDETLRLLNEIDEKFELVFEDLTQVPEYAEFVKSPQYREWMESRGE